MKALTIGAAIAVITASAATAQTSSFSGVREMRHDLDRDEMIYRCDRPMKQRGRR
jgi:hypothetical protein